MGRLVVVRNPDIPSVGDVSRCKVLFVFLPRVSRDQVFPDCPTSQSVVSTGKSPVFCLLWLSVFSPGPSHPLAVSKGRPLPPLRRKLDSPPALLPVGSVFQVRPVSGSISFSLWSPVSGRPSHVRLFPPPFTHLSSDPVDLSYVLSGGFSASNGHDTKCFYCDQVLPFWKVLLRFVWVTPPFKYPCPCSQFQPYLRFNFIYTYYKFDSESDQLALQGLGFTRQ